MTKHHTVQNTLETQIQATLKHALQTLIIQIDDPKLTIAKKVHQSRKMCKKSRAILQLIRPLFKDKEKYAKENLFFKTMAKSLASSREAKVMYDMYEILISTYQLQHRDFKEIQNALLKEKSDRNFNEEQMVTKLYSTKLALSHAIDNLKSWELEGESYEALQLGFKTTYKKARKNMKEAYKIKHGEAFHEFRKYAKYHMFHTNLLIKYSLLPQKRERTLKKLTDILGVEHDLLLFEEYLNAYRPPLNSSQTMIIYIHKKQKAFQLESQLFHIPPNRLTHYALF
ncbi:MAG: CHAD domain-containing protein [Epsilonproteobacteria bacterium]|nr:CHAD domain-containing protein [Campylobacterota bacterium]